MLRTVSTYLRRQRPAFARGPITRWSSTANYTYPKNEKLDVLLNIYVTLLGPVIVATTTASVVSTIHTYDNDKTMTPLEMVITSLTIGMGISITYPISYPLFTLYSYFKSHDRELKKHHCPPH